MDQEAWLKPGSKGRVLIVGFGIDAGASAARFFLDRGWTVTVYDAKPEEAFSLKDVQPLRDQGVTFQFGAATSQGEYDLVIRSPGILPTHPIIAAYLHEKIPVSSATNIFLALCPGKIIGVTGTKGKGTTASFIYEILKADNKKVVLGGNIGQPMLDMLRTIDAETIVVLELSSFQLMDATRSPHVAVVLMITADHLDVHASLREYVNAKARIGRYQKADDLMIYNADYPESVYIATQSKAKKYVVSTKEVPQEEGCFIEGNEIVLHHGGVHETIEMTRNVQLPGRHNLENVCAAVAAARNMGASDEAIKKTIITFKGLEHRLEFVREVQGVKYYNDSFATNPSSTIAAIEAFDVPEVLIVGGSTKGSDFSELVRVISKRKNIRAIIGIGEEWPKIKSAIQAAGASDIHYIEDLTKMKNIVAAAHDVAQMGDIVLLSPACASFGLFKNYKDRGEQFKTAVNEL